MPEKNPGPTSSTMSVETVSTTTSGSECMSGSSARAGGVEAAGSSTNVENVTDDSNRDGTNPSNSSNDEGQGPESSKSSHAGSSSVTVPNLVTVSCGGAKVAIPQRQPESSSKRGQLRAPLLLTDPLADPGTIDSPSKSQIQDELSQQCQTQIPGAVNIEIHHHPTIQTPHLSTTSSSLSHSQSVPSLSKRLLFLIATVLMFTGSLLLSPVISPLLGPGPRSSTIEDASSWCFLSGAGIFVLRALADFVQVCEGKREDQCHQSQDSAGTSECDIGTGATREIDQFTEQEMGVV